MSDPLAGMAFERPNDHHGAYRWYYFDFQAEDISVVVIFLLGSNFSARYLSNPTARPSRHCSVNVVVHHKNVHSQERRRVSQQAWALTEYPESDLSRTQLRIGASRCWYSDTGLGLAVQEQTTPPWSFVTGMRGKPLQLHLETQARWADSPSAVHRLHPTEQHHWQVRLAGAPTTLTLNGESHRGWIYHDTNWGEQHLGDGLRGWTWQRTHSPQGTTARLSTFHDTCATSAHTFNVCSNDGEAQASPSNASDHSDQPVQLTERTGWGLRVPAWDGMQLVDSSPFYARFVDTNAATIAEVCDFARLRRLAPLAHVRTRYASTPNDTTEPSGARA